MILLTGVFYVISTTEGWKTSSKSGVMDKSRI